MTTTTARARAASFRTGKGYQRKQRNVRPTLWDTGEFVAIDGEGFSDGEIKSTVVGGRGNLYHWRDHFYAYLSASDGSEVYSDKRLDLYRCLAFLCRVVENNPKAILVGFGASYDVAHMVMFDLDRAQLECLIGRGMVSKSSPLVVSDDQWQYQLDYRPRKCLTVLRWPAGARRWTYDKAGRRKLTPHLTVRLWDVWGFFQDSFVGVMTKWLPGDPDFDFVQRMKGNRSQFERSELEEIRRYNAAELRCLVKIMNKVRDAISDLGLKITRWDGAGAIAAAMLSAHHVKDHKADPPSEVFEAIRRAYSGGHIEACKIGYHAGPVHHYDVNSAYPDQFRNLPSLADGEWLEGFGDPPPGYTLVNVEFKFPDGLPFYPLFYRCEDGSIFYPANGVGWYWFSEIQVAKSVFMQWAASGHGDDFGLRPRRWFHYRANSRQRPFSWIEDYYFRRSEYIAAGRHSGNVSGPEKIIKLGLNALYGKTAQQVGARMHKGELRLPPFFQLDWAGYVTAGCRAKLMAAALQKPHAIIGFATDGLFSTEPLDLDCPDTKELGAWEYQVHDGITMVMPGVYWLHDGENVKHYSRGFNKAEMTDAEFVHQAWRERKESVPISITRLIGIGSACMSKDFWEMRGAFAASTRYLCLDGDNSKRYPISVGAARPDRGLVDTIPRDHFLPNVLGVPESAPYPISWIDGEGIGRDLLEGEMADELEASDAELA